MFRHDAEAAFAKRFYAVLTAQSGNAVTAADDALLLQYPPRLVGAVCLARLQMQGSDRPQQFSVFYSVTALGPAQPVVKAAAGHAQGPAQPGNPELLAMPPNERVLHGSSRAPSLREVERYTKAADQERVARLGMAALANVGRTRLATANSALPISGKL